MFSLNLSGLDANLISSLNIKPIAYDGHGVSPPENSEIRKIAEDVLGAAQMSLIAIAANPNESVRPRSLEESFKQALNRMPQKKREGYVGKARLLAELPVETRKIIFGRAGDRDIKSHLGVGGFARFDEGIAPLAIDRKLLGFKDTVRIPRKSFKTIPEGLLIPGGTKEFERFTKSMADQSSLASAEKLEEIWGPTYSSDPFSSGPASADTDFEELSVTDKLGFWVTKIKCVDETNPELGHDDIALAGIAVDETGDTNKIPEKFISGEFDDGDQKLYPNWRYHWFRLSEGNHWPKAYSVTLFLAEKDHGGFSDVLNTVWLQVRDKVKSAIEAAVAGALSTYLGPAIALAIGKAVAWIISALVGWIISWFKDDLFPPFIASQIAVSMNARWNYPNGNPGNPSSPIRKATFSGQGGQYYVNYYWKFFS